MLINILEDNDIATYEVAFLEEKIPELYRELFKYDSLFTVEISYIEGDNSMREREINFYGADREVRVLKRRKSNPVRYEKVVVVEKVELAVHNGLWQLIFGRYAGTNNIFKMLHVYFCSDFDSDLAVIEKIRLVKMLLGALTIKLVSKQNGDVINKMIDGLDCLCDFNKEMMKTRQALLNDLRDIFIEASTNKVILEQISLFLDMQIACESNLLRELKAK